MTLTNLLKRMAVPALAGMIAIGSYGMARAENWKYAVIGKKIPTHAELIAAGYTCLNCDKPKVIKGKFTDQGRPDIETVVVAYRNGNSVVGLKSFKDGQTYGIQERDLTLPKDKWDRWAYDIDNIPGIEKANSIKGEQTIVDLKAYNQ